MVISPGGGVSRDIGRVDGAVEGAEKISAGAGVSGSISISAIFGTSWDASGSTLLLRERAVDVLSLGVLREIWKFPIGYGEVD